MQALTIAGPILSAVGTIVGGQQANDVGRYNGRLLDEQARNTTRATIDRENVQRDRNAQDFAAQGAALSQAGVDASTGSALIGVAQGYRDADMDALMSRYEGLMQARDQRIAAGQARYQGRVAKRASYFSAATQLASAAGGYMGMKQAPAPVEVRDIRRSAYWKN